MTATVTAITLTIDGREIGDAQPPYVIAELSANHDGRLETALGIIEMAKRCGADAVKLQTYRPDTLTIESDRPDFKIRGGLWNGRTLYELYEQAQTPWNWHRALFDKARSLGIAIFSTPFDESAVDFLEDLGAPAYKIASFEIVDLALIAYAARTGKPMVISTGMADIEEIEAAAACARESGCEELLLLRCVSGYPAPAHDYHLSTIPDMKRRFGPLVGLSDHTLENVTAIAAVALGAVAIEKHVTLDRSAGGPDDSFSLEEPEFAALCRDTRTAWRARGQIRYGAQASEEANIVFRRSLYAVSDIRAGERFTSRNVRAIRPGYGLPPSRLPELLGKPASCDISYGTALSETHYRRD